MTECHQETLIPKSKCISFINNKVKDDSKSTFITLKTIKALPTLMQLNFKMQSFMLEAIIIKKLSQKVRLPVTEHNSTVKIAFLMRKHCKKSVCYCKDCYNLAD